ncbi:MAG: hypothetical protein K2Q22_11350 [Cytophagales bacterium]|nr:hypothetical protein [Cytophagales bacterium]
MNIFQHITYQKRNQYLLIGSLFFGVLVYLLAISKTWAIYDENKVLTSKLGLINNNPKDLEMLVEKEQILNKQLENYLAKDSISNQGYLLQEISTLCTKNRLILKEFPQAIGQDENDYRIHTIETTAQGSFIGLLKLAYALERSRNVGRLSALKFEKLLDYQSRKEVLTARFYFQTIQEK